MNQANRCFQYLEYLNMVNTQYFESLSNVTTRGLWKLHFTELMVVRLERSTFTHFKSFH